MMALAFYVMGERPEPTVPCLAPGPRDQSQGHLCVHTVTAEKKWTEFLEHTTCLETKALRSIRDLD